MTCKCGLPEAGAIIQMSSCQACSADAGHHVFYPSEEFVEQDELGREILHTKCRTCREGKKPNSLNPVMTCDALVKRFARIDTNDIEDVLNDGLRELGADGLVNPDAECGCELGETFPCGIEDMYGCTPAQKEKRCPPECGGGCQYHMYEAQNITLLDAVVAGLKKHGFNGLENDDIECQCFPTLAGEFGDIDCPSHSCRPIYIDDEGEYEDEDED